MSRSFANPIECYEEIGRLLSSAVREPFSSITVEFELIEIDDVSEQVFYYSPKGRPDKEKQFAIRERAFRDCFFALARLTRTPEKDMFKKCRYVLHQDGRYTVDFEYGMTS